MLTLVKIDSLRKTCWAISVLSNSVALLLHVHSLVERASRTKLPSGLIHGCRQAEVATLMSTEVLEPRCFFVWLWVQRCSISVQLRRENRCSRTDLKHRASCLAGAKGQNISLVVRSPQAIKTQTCGPVPCELPCESHARLRESGCHSSARRSGEESHECAGEVVCRVSWHSALDYQYCSV